MQDIRVGQEGSQVEEKDAVTVIDMSQSRSQCGSQSVVDKVREVRVSESERQTEVEIWKNDNLEAMDDGIDKVFKIR